MENTNQNRQEGLPPYRCPTCGAKHILFAVNGETRAGRFLVPLQEVKNDYTCCVVRWPKCRTMLALVQEMVMVAVYDLQVAS